MKKLAKNVADREEFHRDLRHNAAKITASKWHGGCDSGNVCISLNCINLLNISEVLLMSPKFYASLWVVFAVAVGVMGIGGLLTMLTGVILGFAAFGLVFAGMICVLPGTVSHPVAKAEKSEKRVVASRSSKDRGAGTMHIPFRIRAH